MKRIFLSLLLLAGLSACAEEDWLRQYTTRLVIVDNMDISVSWLQIEVGRFDLHVSRVHQPAGTTTPSRISGAVAHKAAMMVMERRCANVILYGDTALPQPTFSFRAVCPPDA